MAVITAVHIATLVIFATVAVVLVASARAARREADRRAARAEARADVATQRADLAMAGAASQFSTGPHQDIARHVPLWDVIPLLDEDIDRPPQSGNRAVPYMVRARHVGMRTVVEAILAGDYDAVGVEPPRTTADDRAAIVAYLRRGGAESAEEFAAVVGLDLRMAALAADAHDCAGSGCGCDPLDADAILLSAVAFEAFQRADIDAEFSDVWVLAAELARPFALLTKNVG